MSLLYVEEDGQYSYKPSIHFALSVGKDLRILFLNRWVGSHKGGTETHIRELAHRLALRGHEVHILTTEGGELERYKGELEVSYVSRTLGESYGTLRGKRLRATIFLTKSFLKLVAMRHQGLRFDVISVHFATEAILARLHRLIFRCPYVFVFEGYTDWEADQGRYANLQIAISNDIAKKCRARREYLPKVIPVGVNIERFRAESKSQGVRGKYHLRDERLTLTVCQLIPRKDIPTLISSAMILSKTIPQLKMLIVGDGPERGNVESLIREMNLADRVILTGEVSDGDLIGLYRAAELFVLPSVYEGFGIVLVEAMAAGLPVISTTASAIPEVVDGAGLLVPPQDPNRLAETIISVLTNPKLRAEMASKSIMRAANYDWNLIASKYERLYESVTRLV